MLLTVVKTLWDVMCSSCCVFGVLVIMLSIAYVVLKRCQYAGSTFVDRYKLQEAPMSTS